MYLCDYKSAYHYEVFVHPIGNFHPEVRQLRLVAAGRYPVLVPGPRFARWLLSSGCTMHLSPGKMTCKVN